MFSHEKNNNNNEFFFVKKLEFVECVLAAAKNSIDYSVEFPHFVYER